MTPPKIPRFEIINHGYDHSQYFRGCGTTFTKFNACVTGAGDDAVLAYEDALTQLYQNAKSEKDVEWLHLPKRPRGIDKRQKVPYHLTKEENCEHHWYVSIRYRYNAPILDRLKILRSQALVSCKDRGHKMERFVYHRDVNNVIRTGSSQCIRCKKYVQIILKPLPNEIDIGGSAVAEGCK